MAKRKRNHNARSGPRAQAPRPYGNDERRTHADRTEARTGKQRGAVRGEARAEVHGGDRRTAAESRAKVRPAAGKAAADRPAARRKRGRRNPEPQSVEPFTFEEARRSRPSRRRREPTGRGSEITYRLLLTLMIAAALFFIASVFFEVRTVEVTGTDRYLPEQVIQISGIETGDKLLFVNEFEISQNLFSELPYVKAVKVRRRLPNTVVIDITERTPVAKLICGSISYIVDEEACLLDYTVLGEAYRLPVINGTEPTEPKRGKQLNFQDPLMLESLKNVLSQLVKSNWMNSITEIDMEKIYNISFTYGNRFTVVLGDAGNLAYKLSLLEEVLSRLHETDQGIIDLSSPEMARFRPAIL